MPGRLRIALQAAAVSVVALLLALLGWQVFKKDQTPDVGRSAPNFTLPHLGSDRELDLASLRGPAVVLHFCASRCGPCKDRAPVLESSWRWYKDKGVVVLGVDAQDFDVDAQ